MLTMTTLRRLWLSNGPLTAAGLLMVAALAAFLAGLRLDPRVITGAPAWLKPAKFAASTAIYLFTLAWIFSYLPDWPRLRRRVGGFTAAIFVFEVTAIALQAWRGRCSGRWVSASWRSRSPPSRWPWPCGASRLSTAPWAARSGSGW